MGIVHDVQIASRSVKVSDAAFVELAIALARGGHRRKAHRAPGWTIGPVAIATGSAAGGAGFAVDESGVFEGAQWHSRDLDALAVQLPRVLAKQKGKAVTVWYAALDPDNPALGLDEELFGECRVTLKRFAKPKRLVEENVYVDDFEPAAIETTVAFNLNGKRAPSADDVLETPIGVALRRAFGRDLFAFTSLW